MVSSREFREIFFDIFYHEKKTAENSIAHLKAAF